MPETIEGRSALTEAAMEIRRRQDELLGLDEAGFRDWCTEVALLREDSVIGLVFRLRRDCHGARCDGRLVSLRRAEECVVDQLDRDELVERLEAGRMTGYQCEYWYSRRPREVPTVDGHPVWFARTLADVVG